MRLLFDHNLSPALTTTLSDLYPRSMHVWGLEMDRVADTLIWDYAREQGFVIVPKDIDYHDLSNARGHPPRVIWIRLGNCPTAEVATLFRSRHGELVEFYHDRGAALLELR